MERLYTLLCRLPECCRRSRSRPVTGSCRGPPGPRSGCWGCETEAFSSFCWSCFSSSCQRIYRQQSRCSLHKRRTHAYIAIGTCAFQSGLVTPCDALGNERGGRQDGWMDKRMDGCNRAGGRRACTRLLPAHCLLCLSLLYALPYLSRTCTLQL